MRKTDKPTFIDAKRRGFLQGAAVATGAAATGAASAMDVDKTSESLKTDDNQSNSGGYRRTDHVSRYYSRARF